MKISLVVPVSNEEATIPIIYKTVREFDELKEHKAIINTLALSDSKVKAPPFTRNFGKEPALFSGLDNATGDAVIPIDVDLQDSIEVIPHLIEKWQSGADMVLAKRTDRSTDGRIKRKSAEMFYKPHNKISNPKIEENAGDFRLMSREIVVNIKLMPERNFFMKGKLSWVGGNVDVVEYARTERIAGSTKFDGWKLWSQALEVITSFSTFPLRILSYVGLFVAGLLFIYGVGMIADTIFLGNPVRGYPSLLVLVLFIGWVQLIGNGVLGE
ncbi:MULTISPECIES: glycosyltransferase family 2 protein [unclassified Citrobacter]|uniref:glycosyltransferase family 2 protein n=1 Tax=Citrobacter TaxID=544 RepID=UPI0025780D51|nr:MULTISPECIES: glycosyltransferase family 2 protein [unclassified Citrobacter]MDM2786567.1 glycosyltransferase family 2 protein [Citrobacter sp. Cpo113]MDM2839038.1 glycosyltransferase family 2 protein [Citrobacter sp. Cpo086]MDQ2228956.1 glycosyltransferase family 2 protein [Citrobacter portucalensis]